MAGTHPATRRAPHPGRWAGQPGAMPDREHGRHAATRRRLDPKPNLPARWGDSIRPNAGHSRRAAHAQAAGAAAGDRGAPAAHGPLGRGHRRRRHRLRARLRRSLRERHQTEPDPGHGRIGQHLPPGLLEITSHRSLRAGPAVPGFRPVRRARPTRSVPGARPAVAGADPGHLGKHRRARPGITARR